MNRLARAAALVLAVALAPVATAAQQVHQTSAGPVEVSRVVAGLDVPWAVAFIPGGFLVTERRGRLLHFADGGYRLVANVPAVWAHGQGGLLDVALAPDFAQSRTIYLSYSEPGDGGTAGTTVARARLADLESRTGKFDEALISVEAAAAATRDPKNHRYTATNGTATNNATFRLTLTPTAPAPSARVRDQPDRHNGDIRPVG